MYTRREFGRVAAGSAMAMAATGAVSGAASAGAGSEGRLTYRQGRPLLELQQEFLDLRLGMFIHFNMATFQDREWGDPTGPTEAFDPMNLDTDGWAKAALSAHMGYGCLTTKHHDGFCLWPTKSGGDSILKAPGKIDVVKAYTDSFRRHGLKVGLYYSILDLRGDIRHHNVTPAKIARIKLELTELLTNYGDINVLIFDGWDAPWSRIPYDEVPFHEIYALVKKLQPNCLISELNASQYPPTALYYSDIKAFEQNAGQKLPSESPIPAQSCVTLTDGWFWKLSDANADLKSAKQVVEEWLIPQNALHCNLIVNAAPDRSGRFAPNVVARLAEIGKLWKNPGPADKVAPSVVITTPNLATGRPIHASESPDTIGPDLANDGKFGSTWHLPSGSREGWLEVELSPGTKFNTLVLVEPIGMWDNYKTSRLSAYKFEAWDGRAWTELAAGTASHPVRIHTIARTSATKVRLSFTASEDMPHVAEIGLYDEPR